ncbi:MAG: hypothetical protein IJ597_00330, partial [Synergistaceae bacterium]|nr:hypothetical protein [Synergistaceae bacterium]
DPKMIQWIIETNQRFSAQASPYLLKDFMTLERNFKGNSEIKFIQRIDLKATYELAQEKGFDAAFNEIKESIEQVKTSGVSAETLMKRNTSDYEGIREQLIIRPLNYKRYMNELSEYVYRRTGDIAFVLYQLLSYSKENGISSSRIRRDDLRKWNMQDKIDDVMKNALENTARIFPAVVYDYAKDKQVDFLNDEFTKEDITNKQLSLNVILLSTEATTNGALALFYPGVCEKMLKIMGGSFAAVFMNINDVMIFEKNDQHINACLQAAKNPTSGEFLSSRLFIGSDKGINPA